ncbi:hypothetical protein MG293_002270 [Ovis ammon polii]|uniref:Uncharacterized protein n=1 Tax=Ovis ammon polii TaxID=230172 RepID=A0AAD4YGB5_OVIAM|nr:hypothetical protein MG293_002270 [Ovis ammon polii]
MSKGRRFPVNIKATVFHGKGLFLSGAKATTGFIYKGLGCISELDEDGDEGEGEVENADWGALSGSTRLVPVGGSPRPMTYIVGLMDSGEGSVTFPSSLADVLLEDADAFNLVYGSLTFLFMFAYEGRVAASSTSGPEDKGQGHLGHTPQHPQAPESIQKESGIGFESYPNKPVRKQQKTSMGADPRGEWMNGNLSPVSMDKAQGPASKIVIMPEPESTVQMSVAPTFLCWNPYPKGNSVRSWALVFLPPDCSDPECVPRDGSMGVYLLSDCTTGADPSAGHVLDEALWPHHAQPWQAGDITGVGDTAEDLDSALPTDWKVTEEVSISGEKARSVRNEEALSIHGTDVDCGMVKVPDFDPDSDSDPKPNPSDLIYPMDTQAPL